MIHSENCLSEMRGISAVLRAAQKSGREDGQAMVETAMSITFLLMLIFVFMASCLMLYTYSMISESARAASRYAAVHGANCTAVATASICPITYKGFQTALQSGTVAQLKTWPNLAGGTMTYTVLDSTGASNNSANIVVGSNVTVKIQYTFSKNLPLVPSSWTTANLLTTSSTMNVLQ